jgi:hypothetical protein
MNGKAGKSMSIKRLRDLYVLQGNNIPINIRHIPERRRYALLMEAGNAGSQTAYG